MLTACAPTLSEDAVRDRASDAATPAPSQTGLKEGGGSKGNLALLLTDLEVRAVPLLEPSGPVPKPRRGSCSGSAGQRRSLVEALRSGTETGERVLKLHGSAEASNGKGAAQGAGSRDSEGREPGGNVRGSAYKRLDSLEETIRELEKTLMEIGGHSAVEQLYAQTPAPPATTTRWPGKPPVPPKPSSLSAVFVQVDAARRGMLCCFSSSAASLWVTAATFRLLVSGHRPHPRTTAF